MKAIEVYLAFEGNCEVAFNYYKDLFGGSFETMERFSDMPPVDGFPVSEELKEKIMHVEFRISEHVIIMGSDFAEGMGPGLIVGNNITLSIAAESKEEADKLFAGLSDKGQVSMPMETTFWGSYFGQCTDQFGINWMISFPQDTSE